MSVIHRIAQIIKHKSISVRAFERRIGLSNNTIQAAIKRSGGVKVETLNKILKVFPDINPVWLLTGKGKMISEAMVEEPENVYENPKNKLTDSEKEMINDAFLFHPEEVLKIPAVKKWHKAEILDCENRIMREFMQSRQSGQQP